MCIYQTNFLVPDIYNFFPHFNRRIIASKSKKDADIDAKAAGKTAAYWSLFLNNTLYFSIFSFLAFYALSTIAIPYNFTLSNSIAAALVWQLSTTN